MIIPQARDYRTSYMTMDNNFDSINLPASAGLKRRYMTVPQVCEYWGVGKSFVYGLISRREVPFLKMGRLIRFDVRLLDEWAAKRMIRSRPT